MSSHSSTGTHCNISQAQVKCLFAKIYALETDIGKLQRKIIDLEAVQVEDTVPTFPCPHCGSNDKKAWYTREASGSRGGFGRGGHR